MAGDVRASVPIPDMVVVCPECEVEIPITVEAILEEGNLKLDVSTADVWAHAFTHEMGSTTSEVKDRRPSFGPCPSCGAREGTWCRDDCPLIDPSDYR